MIGLLYENPFKEGGGAPIVPPHCDSYTSVINEGNNAIHYLTCMPQLLPAHPLALEVCSLAATP